MRCETVREAVSALLDGEEAPLSAGVVERHLEGCAGCRRWQAEAVRLTRTIRVTVAEDVPDLTGAILSAADVGTPQRPGAARRAWRAGLVVVAIAQLLLGATDFAGAGSEATHAVREVGSWDVALAVGFLVVAAWPARAWGMVPLVAAVVASLAAGSVIDLLAGDAVPLREVTHGFEVAGLVLVWLLARSGGPEQRAPASAGRGLGGDEPGDRAPDAAQPASRPSAGGVAGRVA